MDRITGTYIDVVGGKRRFRDRNLPAGQRGTIPNADYENPQQEELIGGLIEGTGQVPDPEDWRQIAKGVRRLAGGNVTGALTSTALTPDQAGLVVAVASAPLTLTLPKASTVAGIPLRYEIVRADTTSHAVTVAAAAGDFVEGVASVVVPVGLRVTLVSDGASAWYVVSETAPARSVASNGWVRLPGGLIVQWGNKTTDGSGGASVTFPIAFPSGAWQLALGSNVTAAVFHTYQTLNASGFFMQSWNATTGAPLAAQNASFLAFGR